jgi:hypothetical protein
LETVTPILKKNPIVASQQVPNIGPLAREIRRGRRQAMVCTPISVGPTPHLRPAEEASKAPSKDPRLPTASMSPYIPGVACNSCNTKRIEAVSTAL